jgi:hypothetical protein
MSRRPGHGCPAWCVADHATEDDPGVVRHRGATRIAPVVLEGRPADGPYTAELYVEISRRNDEEPWVYLGDGWSGFSLTPESAARLATALDEVLTDGSTLDPTGL